MSQTFSTSRVLAAESPDHTIGILALIAVCACVLLGFSADVRAFHGQPEHETPHEAQPSPQGGTVTEPPAAPGGEGGQPDSHAPAAGAHGEEAEHESGITTLLARLLNFAILAGTLIYLLRSPLATYLSARAAAVRKDLVDARTLREAADAQLRQIDAQLRALPGEIEALKARGAEEIAAEEARIAKTAETDRERLLEQTRREIELQTRIARRDLVATAADLAVGGAADRIKRTITDQDQLRLVDQYLSQVSARHD